MFEERFFSSGLLELPPNSVKQKEMANNTEAHTPLFRLNIFYCRCDVACCSMIHACSGRIFVGLRRCST
jgi:hypothetical protein